MELSHGEDIETLCQLCAARNTGKTPSVDWVTGRDGRRFYVCEDHAQQLTRYGRELEDLDDTPEAEPCRNCMRLTLMEDLQAGKRWCPECEGTVQTAEAILDAHGGNVPIQRSVAILNELMEDQGEDVDPEAAAAAIEDLTGVEMEPVEPEE